MNNSKNEIIKNQIVYVFLFLFSLNFFNKSNLISLLFSLFVIVFNYNKIKKVNLVGILVLLFSVCTFFLSMYYFNVKDAIKMINFFLIYFSGRICYSNVHDKERFIFNCIFSVFLGISLYLLLTLIFNKNITNRYIINIWTREQTSATAIGLICSIPIGFSYYGIFCQKKIILKLLSLISLIIVLIINFKSATRTPIILFVIVYIILILIKFIDSKVKNKFKIALGILCFCLIICYIFNKNFLNIKNFLLNSELIKRFSSEKLETGRIAISVIHFNNMFKYPFGGNNIYLNTGFLAHNILQEGYDRFGFFPTLLLTIILLNFAFLLVKISIKKNKNSCDYLLISFSLAIFIQLFMEPIFSGYIYLFFISLFLQGILDLYVSK